MDVPTAELLFGDVLTGCLDHHRRTGDEELGGVAQHHREVAEHRKNNELDRAQKEAEIKDKQIELTKQNEEKQFTLDRYRVEQNEAIASYKLEQQAERERQKMMLHLERTQKDVEAQKLVHREEADALRKKIEAENTTSPVILEKHFTIDRNWPGPDQKASIQPEELVELVNGSKAINAAMGNKKNVFCLQLKFHLNFNISLILI